MITSFCEVVRDSSIFELRGVSLEMVRQQRPTPRLLTAELYATMLKL